MLHIEVKKGTPLDIEEWMEFVKKVRTLFPGLETDEALAEHKSTVLKFITLNEQI